MVIEQRAHYLERILRYQDTDAIKIITGVRRCGKSTLLQLARTHIQNQGVAASQTISLDFESLRIPIHTEEELYAYVKAHISPEGTTYIFLDEVQMVNRWERAVNAMRVDFDCDLYVTGSNAQLLSSELATLLSGRTDVITVHPLALSEYLTFLGYEEIPESPQLLIHAEKGTPTLFDDVFNRYLTFGGFPALAYEGVHEEQHRDYMKNLVDSIVMRDVLSRTADSAPTVRQQTALHRIIEFMADNIGNMTSPHKVTAALKQSEKDMASYHTVRAYIDALTSAHLFTAVPRYDMQGKKLLTSNPKYYIEDLGLRSYFAHYQYKDAGRVFETAVFHELVYRGFDVRVGKQRQGEVDFVVSRGSTRAYIQATLSMESEETLHRELAPLRRLRDSAPKTIIVRSGIYPDEIEGIRILPAHKFFLGEDVANYY